MIGFIFKIIFSTILGGSISYSPSVQKQNTVVALSALVAVVSTAIFGGITFVTSPLQSGLAFGAMVMMSVFVYKLEISVIRGMCAICIGMLMGLGFPVLSVIFTVAAILLIQYLKSDEKI